MKDNGASGGSGFDPAEVIRISLERALESTPFATADRLRRFLRYIVEKSLSGQPEALREYSIGVEVYGRKPDFDPRVDAIVRVEASRLRNKLREYYDAAGSRDSIRIELPKGAYVPLFNPHLPEPDSAPEPQRRSWRPAAIWVAIAVCLAGLVYWIWPAAGS